ncbi:hypothetical protein L5515_006648 [Caenorhabditis briggsae]|uniref:Uncharacterized protein n=1 Tax=Caenorhabditis briggsae TaxID=6238 RepID=A0AAE9JIE3_CAEBR|nr:hypothetical protein L5515_006648 [Caenorhabditis briggsae]
MMRLWQPDCSDTTESSSMKTPRYPAYFLLRRERYEAMEKLFYFFKLRNSVPGFIIRGCFKTFYESNIINPITPSADNVGLIVF